MICGRGQVAGKHATSVSEDVRICYNRRRVDKKNIGGTIKQMPAKSIETAVVVGAYSGYKANERPLHFIKGETRIQVKEVLDRWYGPESDYFKVLGENGLEYVLEWRRDSDRWFLIKEFEAKDRPEK